MIESDLESKLAVIFHAIISLQYVLTELAKIASYNRNSGHDFDNKSKVLVEKCASLKVDLEKLLKRDEFVNVAKSCCCDFKKRNGAGQLVLRMTDSFSSEYSHPSYASSRQRSLKSVRKSWNDDINDLVSSILNDRCMMAEAGRRVLKMLKEGMD